MLCLARKWNESIVIDGETTITFCPPDRGGMNLRVYINAPHHVRVDRKEIHDDREKNGPRPARPPQPKPTP